jgi:hypothetical protein
MKMPLLVCVPGSICHRQVSLICTAHTHNAGTLVKTQPGANKLVFIFTEQKASYAKQQIIQHVIIGRQMRAQIPLFRRIP